MEFKWLNESKIIKNDDRWEISATEQSDFFCNNGAISEEGITPESLKNAPFYYTEINGDFVMRVKVSLTYADQVKPLPFIILQMEKIFI